MVHGQPAFLCQGELERSYLIALLPGAGLVRNPCSPNHLSLPHPFVLFAHPQRQVAIEQQQPLNSSIDSAVDYLFIVNGDSQQMDDLRALAHRHTNVRVFQRPNSCYDGGSIGEVLRAHPDLSHAYAFFVFINSSVRGPFFPRYFQRRPWTQAFTALLTDDVKLVGTTISCEISVHVQSMVLAMDRVGLDTIAAAGALKCPLSLGEAVASYELGSSAAILDAGFNIDSLMIRYRGIDWRHNRDLRCNAQQNPQKDGMNDGLALDPFEVLFVKAKASLQVPAIIAFLSRYTKYYLRWPGAGGEARVDLEANTLFDDNNSSRPG